MRVAILDLEMYNLHADFGLIICGVIQEYGGSTKEVYRLDDKKYMKQLSWGSYITKHGDIRLVEALKEALEKYDLWVTYNGKDFDIPFLNTRLLYHDMEPLRFEKHEDMLLVARRNLRLSSNRLANVSAFFNLPEKTIVRGQIWVPALAGDKAALDYIVDHCVKDVDALTAAYDKLRRFIRVIRPYA